jgi:uncharacterized membrane protein
MALFKNVQLIILCLVLMSGCTKDVDFEPNGAVTKACAPVISESDLARNNVWHAAKLRGVAFRAIGQEPAWLLEITNGKSILLSTDYGQTKTLYDYVEPTLDNDHRHTEYHVSGDTNIIIDGETCTDIMSGESFEVTVSIKQNSGILYGCGRALF